jgi:hypothetical protein
MLTHITPLLRSSENPYALHEKPLHDPKFGVWVAISRWRIVSPLFFEETVNVIQCSTISSAYLRKIKSPNPSFNKMALLSTQLTTL